MCYLKCSAGPSLWFVTAAEMKTTQQLDVEKIEKVGFKLETNQEADSLQGKSTSW